MQRALLIAVLKLLIPLQLAHLDVYVSNSNKSNNFQVGVFNILSAQLGTLNLYQDLWYSFLQEIADFVQESDEFRRLKKQLVQKMVVAFDARSFTREEITHTAIHIWKILFQSSSVIQQCITEYVEKVKVKTHLKDYEQWFYNVCNVLIKDRCIEFQEMVEPAI